MAGVNSAITSGFDSLFTPFAGLSPWWGISVVSLATATFALLIFRHSSNQQAIRAVKARILSHLLEVWLYRDEPRVVVMAQIRLAMDSIRYFVHGLVPLACMAVPVGIVVLQTDLRYGHRPLRPQERAVLTVTMASPQTPLGDASLLAASGVAVETPPVRVPALGEVAWRVRAVRQGEYAVKVRIAESEITKRVVVDQGSPRVSVQRVRGVWAQFLHPGEQPLPASGPILRINLGYPRASLPLLGWRLHWVWPFFALTLMFGYLLRTPLRVEI